MTKIIVEIDNAEKAVTKKVRREHEFLKEAIVKRKNPAVLKYLV